MIYNSHHASALPPEERREALRDMYMKIFQEFKKLVAEGSVVTDDATECNPTKKARTEIPIEGECMGGGGLVVECGLEQANAAICNSSDDQTTPTTATSSASTVTLTKTITNPTFPTLPQLGPYQPPSQPTKIAIAGHDFRNILYAYIDNPTRYTSSIYVRTTHCTVVYDAYPKARVHLLVLPHRGFLDSVGCARLTPAHAAAVREMHELARHIASSEHIQRAAQQDGLAKPTGSAARSGAGARGAVMIGYHAQPSLHPLHLHIISSDLDSPCLKVRPSGICAFSPFVYLMSFGPSHPFPPRLRSFDMLWCTSCLSLSLSALTEESALE